jgi:aldehyde:ferredoxin oxidoreductase
MNGEYGWAGKILLIDLSERRIETVSSSDYAGGFIGGIGTASKIIWDRVDLQVKALEPENHLIFSTGPLTGTAAPASGRFELMAKSPTSYPGEFVTRSGLGGHWGPELKYAGFDALVVYGKAERPVYLWIEEGEVRIQDASDIWGMDTYATQKLLIERHDPRAKVLCIGRAGENLVRFAAIMSETGFASGKSGFGAVMGSKNLKAIGVRGRKAIKISRPEALKEISEQVKVLTARNPMQEWTTGHVYPSCRQEFFKHYRVRNTGCFGCPIPCFAFVKVPGVGNSQMHCFMYEYMEAASVYQPNFKDWAPVFMKTLLLVNRLGVDIFELAGILHMLLGMYKSGIITEKDAGIPLSTYGSEEFFSVLLSSIVERRGIGDLLAEGAPRAADKIPGAWPIYEKFHPAHGYSEHDSVREFPAIALLWALDTRDPLIDHHAYRHLAVSRQQWPEPHTLPAQKADAIAQQVFGTERAIDHTTYDHKARAVIYAQNRSAVINLLVLCDWLYPIIQSQITASRKGDTSLESKMLSAVTGIDICEIELDKIGEKVWNLMRCIAVREGRTREKDTLHESYFRAIQERNPKTEKVMQLKAVPRKVFEKAKDEYYQLRGWNIHTGWPTDEKLRDLGLGDIALKLQETNRPST